MALPNRRPARGQDELWVGRGAPNSGRGWPAYPLPGKAERIRRGQPASSAERRLTVRTQRSRDRRARARPISCVTAPHCVLTEITPFDRVPLSPPADYGRVPKLGNRMFVRQLPPTDQLEETEAATRDRIKADEADATSDHRITHTTQCL